MKDLNMVRSSIGVLQKTIGPFIKKGAEIEMIRDPKAILIKKNFKHKATL